MLKKITVALAIVLAGLLVGEAQITVPHTFTTSVPVSQLNTNLSTLGSGSLNRAGGTITGNITVSPGVTIDNIDIGAELDTTGDLDVDSLRLYNTGATALDVDGGITAGSGNVGIVDITGKIPAISSTYFASLSGANLTSIPWSAITTPTWAAHSHSAGDYTTNGAGGWTVEVGDVFVFRYVEIGKTMHVNVILTTTSAIAATGSELRIKVPNSRTVASAASGPLTGLNNSATFSGVWQVIGGNTYISLFSDATLGTNWTASSNTTQIRLSCTFEIQ